MPQYNQQSPMLQYYMQMMQQQPQQGAVHGPLNALADALRMGVGAYGAKKEIGKGEAKDAAYTQDLAQMLGSMNDPNAMVNEVNISPRNAPQDFDYGASPTRAATTQEAFSNVKNPDLIEALAPGMFRQRQEQEAAETTRRQGLQDAETKRQADLQAEQQKPYTLNPGDTRFQGNQQIAGVPAEAKPPQTRNYNRGDTEITEQFNPQTGSFDPLSTAPRYKPATNSDGPREPLGYRRTADGNLEPIPGGPGQLRNTAQGFNQENTLRDEYQLRSKDFGIMQDAYKKIVSVDDSPAGDLSRLYSYVKMLDPNSVVRESEFAIASTARPLLERMGVSWDAVGGVWRGERMTPSMRADFLKQADNLFQSSAQQQAQRDSQYEGLAKQYQLEPGRVVTGVRTGDTQPPPAAEAPAGVTEEDIQHTMKLHNVTREEVMRRLQGGP